MTAPVALVPLKCVRCDTPVPANSDEVAWVCAQCGQGLRLDFEQGLGELDVHYASGIPPDAVGRPFWVAQGQVAMDRSTYEVFGDRGGDAEDLWGEGRNFFVPAFTCPLDTLIDLGVGMLRRPPETQPGSQVPFEPVTLAQEDVPALAEFIVLAIEAERRDQLKQVAFNLTLDPPVLWILP